MNVSPFRYVRAADEKTALDAIGGSKSGDASKDAENVSMLAGGTNLIDMMRLGIMRPNVLVDVSRLPLAAIESGGPDGLSIGAMARNSDVAYHAIVQEQYPVLSEALLSGASPQLRNLATVGGNLLQRTRCAYFRDVDNAQCNKRKPGSGCAAMDGWTRMHAVLGASDHCIATHPSDMCVALVALDAVVHLRGAAKGDRAVPIADFHTLPADHPEVESLLGPGEIIVRITLPPSAAAFAKHSRYVKVRDRAAFAFALASCAACLELDDKGMVKQARIALGGVATKPWRSAEAEKVIVGKKITPAILREAGEAAMKDAKARADNAFKVELGKRVVARAIDLAMKKAAAT